VLRNSYEAAAVDVLSKFGLAAPSLKGVGINTQGLPPPASMPKAPATSGMGAAIPKNPLTASASMKLPSIGKMAAQEGMAGAGFTGGAGAVRGDPADAGVRQRSTIARAFTANDSNFATSDTGNPGSVAP